MIVTINWNIIGTYQPSAYLKYCLTMRHISYNDFLATVDGACTQVHHVGNGPPIDQCNHEEANTRVLVYLFHALQSPSLRMVPTGDTTVVVIFLSNLYHINALNPTVKIWISFKAGMTNKIISLYTIATHLGTTTCKPCPFSKYLLDQTVILPSSTRVSNPAAR